jgi:peroxiredoxin
MKNALLRLLPALLLLFSASVSPLLNAAELKKTEMATPPLKLQSLKGDSVDLNDFKGKVVLVQFWATYCTPCRKEMPSMNNLIKKLEESKTPFKILAVNMGESKADVQKFVDEVKPEFTILMDANGENVQAWNVFAAPSNFLIDTKGKIIHTLYGEMEWDSDEIVKTIQGLASIVGTAPIEKKDKEKAVEKSEPVNADDSKKTDESENKSSTEK